MFTVNHTPTKPSTRSTRRAQRYVYAWARSQHEAACRVALPANRFARYRTIADAYAAQEAGLDGFRGEGLFRVANEVPR